ncbi:MAG: prepilin-type N-terminal cleavage/methylation domain-containing protein [Planctomycetota bacterium]
MTERPRSGFTILELMIVVAIIAIVAAVAIPSLLNSRKAANEARAIGSLKTIHAAFEQYRLRFGTYGRLGNLQSAGYIDGFDIIAPARLLSGGYYFNEHFTSDPNRYRIRANPDAKGIDGDRYFALWSNGVIRFSSTGLVSGSDSPLD